jgi:hypothetical protein
MEFKISSVCVVFFSAFEFPFFLFFLSPVVLTSVGVLYFTRETWFIIFFLSVTFRCPPSIAVWQGSRGNGMDRLSKRYGHQANRENEGSHG